MFDRAGRLKFLVTIERRVSTLSATGAQVFSWTQLAQVWAGIEPAKGGDTDLPSGVAGQFDTTIVMRYRADVRPSMRVRYQEEVYSVLAVPPTADRRGLMLQCKQSTIEATA
jgi:SPP1 family predicted phage head-tail adaptor